MQHIMKLVEFFVRQSTVACVNYKEVPPVSPENEIARCDGANDI